ncbi:MAG: hypothetical protein O7D33_02925 [Chloroflexi bacterium]|nr:hypothetical protein [Chloroflexota bacterium]
MQKSIEARRQAIVERLKMARDTHQRCLSDVTAEAGNVGSEWSVADLLRHSSGDGYRTMIARLLEEDKPALASFDRERGWKQLTGGSLAKIDQALELATTLSPEQLAREGERGGKPYGVLDGLETWTAHFEEHLAQLRDEIRPREGLPGI